MKNGFRLLKNADKKIIMEYLNEKPIETTFLIGNCSQFPIENDKNIRRCADYFGYFQGGELKGIIPFYNLGSCIPHFQSENAIPYFVDIMKKRDFSYLLGMNKLIVPLYEELKDCKKVKEHSDDSYYVNENFTPFVINNVNIKEAVEVDVKKAVDFIIESRIKGFDNKNYGKNEALKRLKERAKEEDILFLFVGDKIAAMADIQTFTDRINQIGGVYTSPDYRGNGYCKAVVSHMCKRIIERGKIPTLVVDKSNTPAVKAYSSLGFKHYDDYNILRLES